MSSRVIPFVNSLKLAGFMVSAQPDEMHQLPVVCRYKNNPDGTIRWIWPAKARKADFLKFYHNGGTRANLMAKIIRLMFSLKLGGFFGDGMVLIFTAGSTSADKRMPERWAYFAGTIGPNQKTIFWQQEPTGNKTFTKIALTNRAGRNILREARNINAVDLFRLPLLITPGLYPSLPATCTMEDIGEKKSPVNRLKELPQLALQSWLKAGLKTTRTDQSAFIRSISHGLQELHRLKDSRFPSELLQKTTKLYQRMMQEETLRTAFSHGDFTPWNMRVKGDSLHVIDWELGRPGMPALYDLFHFAYQGNILIDRKPYAVIRDEIATLLNQPEWQGFLIERNLDPQMAECWYLLYTIVYHMRLYSQQMDWHRQVNWLLNCWNDALSYNLASMNECSPRETVLLDLTGVLAELRYAILKWQGGPLTTLPESSDLDLCITREDARKLKSYLARHPLTERLQVKSRSHMKQLKCVLRDGTTIHIDTIFRIKRRSWEFLSIDEVLANTSLNAYGLKVPAAEHDFTYTWLFYWLNGSALPEKHRVLFTFFEKNKRSSITKYVADHYLSTLTDYRSLFLLCPPGIQNEIYRRLKNMPENRGMNRWKNKLAYWVDAAMQLVPQKGFTITFSGVDGAGKSTVIESIRQKLEKNLRQKVVVLRHRPSVLPILSSYRHGKEMAEAKAAASLPRMGNNNSSLSSLLRFTYYYTDYLLGQFYIQLKYVRRGYIVVYDRYYFDFINDSKRSNIQLPSALTRKLYGLLIKPKLNFFLYADAEQIVQRKKELEPDTIRQLTGHYLELFDRLGKRYQHSHYIPVHNEVLPDTLRLVLDHIKTHVK